MADFLGAKTYPRSGNLFGLPIRPGADNFNALIDVQYSEININSTFPLDIPINLPFIDWTQLDIEIKSFASTGADSTKIGAFMFAPDGSGSYSIPISANNNIKVSANVASKAVRFQAVGDSAFAVVLLTVKLRNRKVKTIGTLNTLATGTAISTVDLPFIIGNPKKTWLSVPLNNGTYPPVFVNKYLPVSDYSFVGHIGLSSPTSLFKVINSGQLTYRSSLNTQFQLIEFY